MNNYLPDEAKMKALGYALYLPNPEKPYPAYLDGEREWEIKEPAGRDFIKVYHQYGHVWIGSTSVHAVGASTIYCGVLPNEAFFDQLLQLNNRWTFDMPAAASVTGSREGDAKVEALQAFKDYVHDRLDAAGIDKHEEQNAINGCRIGSRLDDVLAQSAARKSVPLATVGNMNELLKWLNGDDVAAAKAGIRSMLQEAAAAPVVESRPEVVDVPQNIKNFEALLLFPSEGQTDQEWHAKVARAWALVRKSLPAAPLAPKAS